MELLNVPYSVSHRNVKYPRLEFGTGKLLLVLPFDFKPDVLLEKHKGWIIKKTKFIKECLKETSKKKIVMRTEQEFRDLIHSSIKNASKELGGRLKKIYFREMKTKWASCSAQRNLTVNTLMKFLPSRLIRYVICHEIIHLKERRHNGQFWEMVSKKFINYRDLEKDLFVYWFQVAGRIQPRYGHEE
jgi:predicted metal-dependent hydrolase